MMIHSTSKPEETYKSHLFTTVRTKILRIHPGGAFKNHVSKVSNGALFQFLFFVKICETSRTDFQITFPRVSNC